MECLVYHTTDLTAFFSPIRRYQSRYIVYRLGWRGLARGGEGNIPVVDPTVDSSFTRVEFRKKMVHIFLFYSGVGKAWETDLDVQDICCRFWRF